MLQVFLESCFVFFVFLEIFQVFGTSHFGMFSFFWKCSRFLISLPLLCLFVFFIVVTKCAFRQGAVHMFFRNVRFAEAPCRFPQAEKVKNMGLGS